MEIPVGYPDAAPSHRGPVAVVHQDQSLHMLQQVIDGIDVGECRFIALDVFLDDSSVG